MLIMLNNVRECVLAETRDAGHRYRRRVGFAGGLPAHRRRRVGTQPAENRQHLQGVGGICVTRDYKDEANG